MNDLQRAAMQMALEDLRAVWPDSRPSIVALREALAQREQQEPVALEEIRRIVAEYIEPNSQVDSGNLFWALCGALQYIDANLKFNVPTHPIRTKDLTDGELTAIWERNAGDWLACFRAVIAADKGEEPWIS